MFLVNGVPLLEDDLSILQELKRQLAINGVFRFADFKVGAKNIQFNCPIHADGQERKPSCGIKTYSDKNAPAGTVHCFACGYTATLEQMIGHCFGIEDSGQFGARWLIKNFRMIAIENRPDIELDLMRQCRVDTTCFVSDDVLDSYRFTHSYMYERKMTDEIIERFDIGFDNDFVLEDRLKQKHKYQCLTFPVRDVSGRTLFIARRSVSTKFFYIPEDVNKPVYGLYELPSDATEVIICESIFNALTCYVYGKPAVALLGLGTQYQYDQLLQLSVRKYVLGFDGDLAGKSAAERFKKAIGNKKLITVLDVPEGKDLNDLSKEEFEALQEWC